MYRFSEKQIKIENKKYMYFLTTFFILLILTISFFSLDINNNLLNNLKTSINELNIKNGLEKEYQNIILIYTPLFILGIFRILIWFFKKMSSSMYKPIIPTYQKYTKFSIVTAVYNEDVNIFDKALKSWLQNFPDEIIAIIDASDHHCITKIQGTSKRK